MVAPIVAWAPEFGGATPGPTQPGAPSEPAAPPSLPSLPAEWVPAVVGPGLALGLLLIAFAASRGSARSRRRVSPAQRARPDRTQADPMQTSANRGAAGRPRRYIPPEEFEDDSSDF